MTEEEKMKCLLLGVTLTKEINSLLTYLEGLREIPPAERVMPTAYIRNKIKNMIETVPICLTEAKKKAAVLRELESALDYLDKEDLNGLIASLSYATSPITLSALIRAFLE
jgi:hypothetical protein